MRPIILQLDDAYDRQPGFQAAVRARGGRVLPARDLGPALRLWCRKTTLDAVKRRLAAELPDDGAADLVFAGSGDFHHLTALLVERAAARAGEPLTLIHFDNHPDWMRAAPGRHCGSWVGRAARLDGVRRVITVGVTSRDISHAKMREGDLALISEDRLDLFAWTAPDGGDEVTLEGRTWPTIEALGEAAFLEQLAAAIPTRAIYVTIDKDVLRAEDAVTNWDQGRASLAFVLAAVRRIAGGRRLVGADVVGDWSSPVHGGGAAASLLKRGEALLDQPWRRPEPGQAGQLNAAANLRLLDLFAEVAP
jgi:hypothetical protein